jgi:hypothetical protein
MFFVIICPGSPLVMAVGREQAMHNMTLCRKGFADTFDG